MNPFSTANLALVAYATVSGVDASIIDGSGFVSSTKISTGVSYLFLSTSLAQATVTGTYRDIFVVTPGQSNGSQNAKSVCASNLTSTMIGVVFSSAENTDFSIMVLRTVLPPT